jgi:uncharacterized membrane protein
MTTFTVWKFEEADRAEQAAAMVKAAADDGLVTVVDQAIISWPENALNPELHHRHNSTWAGAGWGSFWGIVVGSLFLVPVVGGAVGAGIGALVKATEGTGITKAQLEKIRIGITQGTSALLLVTEKGDRDRLGERLHGLHTELIATNLTDDERDILLETFGDHRP